jgi:hypothetical protein
VAGSWEESKHPRAEDGKFGAGSGQRSASAARLADAGAKRKAAPRMTPEHEARISQEREKALQQAREGYSVLGVKRPAKSEPEAQKYADEIAEETRETILREIKDDETIAANPDLKAALDEMRLLYNNDPERARQSTRSIVEEHEARQDVAAAEDAGHVTVPTKDIEAFKAGDKVLREHLAKAADDQDATARAAFSAVRAANSASVDPDGDDYIPLPEETASAIARLAEEGGLEGKHGDYDSEDEIETEDEDEDEPEEPEEPEEKLSRKEFEEESDEDGGTYEEYEAEHAKEVKEFTESQEKAVEAHRTRALEAQRAFEKLHKQQVDTLMETKKAAKVAEAARDKLRRKYEDDDEDDPVLLNQDAFKSHERWDEDDADNEDFATFVDPDVERDYVRAKKAATWQAAHIIESLEGSFDLEDHTSTMRDGIRATAETIKELAKITKVKPTLAKAAVKASKGRSAKTDDDD